MNNRYSKALPRIIVFVWVVMLTGCIQQDMRIVLRADGSGEYHIKKMSTQIESAMIANIPAKLRQQALKEQQDIQEEYPGGLKLVSSSTAPSAEDPSKFIETSVYSFSNLGEALPALENIISMGPRYRYEGDRFVIFRYREKEEWDGFQGMDGTEDKNYLNLTIELPAEPLSSNGTVSGRTVTWKFDEDDIKKYQEMKIGESLFEASIPASAIQVDLTPRLVQEKETQEKEEKFEPLESFDARFPILGDYDDSKPVTASLSVKFANEELTLPVSYKDLEVLSLIVEGKEVPATLKSETSGVYNGKNVWGQDADGFPVYLEFSATDPWVSQVDLLKVRMNVNVVTERQKTVFEIPAEGFPLFVTPDTINLHLDKVAVAKVNLGSQTSMWPLPGITLWTPADPSVISAVFLDTDYGLRYKAMNITATPKKVDDFWEEDLKRFVKEFFGSQKFFQYDIGFKKIPSGVFKLIVETVGKSDYKARTLTWENIDVSP